MPRFFFDVHDGISLRDRAGSELPNVAAARARAMRIAADYAGNPKMIGSDGGAIVVSVRDDAAMQPLTIRLVFTIEGG